MKKHYIMLLTAGLLSYLAASAQTGALRNPCMLPKLPGITRSSAEILPDSLVLFHETGVKSDKFIYSYSDNGLLLKTEEYFWNEENSEWVFFSSGICTYDDLGRMKTYQMENIEGEKALQTLTYDNNECIYIVDYTSPFTPVGMAYKGNMTLDEHGNKLKEEFFKMVDINGDGKLDEDDWNENGEPWYKDYEYIYEYDALGRELKIVDYNYSNVNYGTISATTETTFVWSGKSYLKTVTEYTHYDGESATMEYRYDVTDGNPEIGIYYSRSKGYEWELTKTGYTYYPKGDVTANETVETPAQDFKISVARGKLLIQTEASVRVQVYSILGDCRYNAIVSGCTTVDSLPSGLYVVCIDDKAQKVYVR